MSNVHVLNLVVSSDFIRPDMFRGFLSDTSTNFFRTIAKCGIPLPLNTMRFVALLLSLEYIERDVEFIRRFFGALPPVKKLRKSRKSFPSALPDMYTLNFGENKWNPLPTDRFVLK